jgi:hypothetical protein
MRAVLGLRTELRGTHLRSSRYAGLGLVGRGPLLDELGWGEFRRGRSGVC